MSKSILLVGKYSTIEPLGLMFLSSALKAKGHRVGIYLIKDENDLLITECFDGRYDYIGFSVYTGFHKTMLRKASVLKEDFKVIIGGPHATFFADECKSRAHYVVVGEGIYAINEILDGRTREGVVFIPDLMPENALPQPDREILYNKYPEFGTDEIKSVISSMNCPWKCTYCFNDSYRKIYPKSFVRQRPLGQVIEDCMELKRYPTKLIYFQDDSFGYNLNWLWEFASVYPRKVGLPFHCQIRPESATEERLSLFKLAGCHGITMAIETFREDTRRNLLNRKMTNDQIYESCRLVKSKGLKLRTEQMLGIPETTFEDELDLLQMNIKINPDIAWTSIFAPYLGTTLGDYCKNNGLYDGNNDDLSDSFFSESKLKFDPCRLKKTNMLHKIFSTCAKIPNGDKLAQNFTNGTMDFQSWFFKMKDHLFENCLYNLNGEK